MVAPPLIRYPISLPCQAGNFVREEILSAFIRLVAHTPELQGYTASKLYLALKADISQESLTLAATWVIGEYSEVLLENGIISDDDQPTRVSQGRLQLTQFTAKSVHLRFQTRKLSTSLFLRSTPLMPIT